MMLSSGTQLGPYKIVAPLGKGGMGEVYRARDKRLDREVAIKVLPEHLAQDADALKRFEREAKAVAALSHPNILTIYDVGSEQGVSFAVMELLEGKTLRSRLAGGPLPWQKAAEIGTAVAEGVAAAHSKGVIHRDLKPENIFITSDGRVKILDFGLARYKPQLPQQELTEAPTESRMTETGVLMGTVPYMSPEQVRGEPVDAQSDIFAFGCVLYEMITGKRAFSGNTAAETVAAILKEEPPFGDTTSREIPAELERIIRHCLEKDLPHRFHSAHDLAFDLKSIPAGTSKSVPAVVARPARLRVGNWIAALVLGVAALIVGLNVGGVRNKFLLGRASPEIRSIAVLPLKNLSGDPKQEYFSDGMTEELITSLAHIETLRVISRTSVMEYKGGNKKIPEIAKELNVDAIVEGSVFQSGEKVRITAQLIHAATDRHLWAQSYERNLSDVIALQNEVASAIAQEIKIKLTPQEQAHFTEAPKVKPEAYQAYLRGLELRRRYVLKLAVEMFQRAVEIAPDFAHAYAQMSIAHSDVYHEGIDRTPSRLRQAKSAADRSLELQPGFPEAKIALGYYYYWGYKDYAHALKEFQEANKLLPNYVDILVGIGAVYRRQGDLQSCLNYWKRALKLDPRNATNAYEIGLVYWALRNHAEADRYMDRAIAIEPEVSSWYDFKALNQLAWTGSIQTVRLILEKKPKKAQPEELETEYNIELFERKYASALTRVSSKSVEAFSASPYFTPKGLLIGQLHMLMNQPGLAKRAFDEARRVAEKALKESADDSRIHAALGLAYAGLGRKQEAIRNGKRAVELLPISRDAWQAPVHREELARTYIMIREYDAALDQIEYLLSIPSWVTVPLLRIDPAYDPLRNHPRFQELLQKYDHAGT